MQIFYCWKQCCTSSCVKLFKSCVAFAFTASTDSNLVPLSADLIFGKRKKSHGARSGEYCGCSITGMLFFAKYLFIDSALCAGALSWWRIHEASFRHPINVDNPPDIEKNNHHFFEFGLAHARLGDWGLFQCMDFLLVSGSYWKIQVSSHVITFRKKSGTFSMFSRVSAQQFTRYSFC